MTLDLIKPVQTREGGKVRILCTDARTDWPIVGLLPQDDGTDRLVTWNIDGKYLTSQNHFDLVNTPECHKHADLIIAWANGAIIERLVYFQNNGILHTFWEIDTLPSWLEDYEYRIKP